jgi:2-polyprenyl-6-methoxyphenol hydroxylase-like FAD-dependent oxidoreductase
MASRTSVLIVGGSLNGLTTALLLAHHGVDCMVVERHPDTTIQYKFRGISPRSMEIYRGLGIQDDIRAHLTGDQKAGDIARARNLSDPNVQWLGKPWADTAAFSAATAETCDQDRLEPILRAHAQRLGADIRFNTEFVAFEQDALAVRCVVRHTETRVEEHITAAYLVAADGVGGQTREKLGIGRHGPGELQHWMNLIFDTDLQPSLQGRRFTSCFVTDVNGAIVPRDDRWLLSLQYSPERGERPEDFDQARTEQLVRQAAGRSDSTVRLFDARHWDVFGLVADRFSEGRAFLIGDAAHAIPPTGGFGGNTGIHDAHNLAWKLAFVLQRGADVALLDSYDTERRHAAERTLAQALARLAAWFKDPTKRLPAVEPIVDDLAVIFGQLYSDGAVISEGNVGGNEFEDPRQPSGRPGSRAPHFELTANGRRVPVHDLFDREFVLLAGAEAAAWEQAATTLRERRALPLSRVRVGDGASRADHAEFTRKYGVKPDGAVLVRPDGVIAWRSPGAAADAEAELRRALTRLGLGMSS